MQKASASETTYRCSSVLDNGKCSVDNNSLARLQHLFRLHDPSLRRLLLNSRLAVHFLISSLALSSPPASPPATPASSGCPNPRLTVCSLSRGPGGPGRPVLTPSPRLSGRLVLPRWYVLTCSHAFSIHYSHS